LLLDFLKSVLFGGFHALTVCSSVTCYVRRKWLQRLCGIILRVRNRSTEKSTYYNATFCSPLTVYTKWNFFEINPSIRVQTSANNRLSHGKASLYLRVHCLLLRVSLSNIRARADTGSWTWAKVLSTRFIACSLNHTGAPAT